MGYNILILIDLLGMTDQQKRTFRILMWLVTSAYACFMIYDDEIQYSFLQISLLILYILALFLYIVRTMTNQEDDNGETGKIIKIDEEDNGQVKLVDVTNELNQEPIQNSFLQLSEQTKLQINRMEAQIPKIVVEQTQEQIQKIIESSDQQEVSGKLQQVQEKVLFHKIDDSIFIKMANSEAKVDTVIEAVNSPSELFYGSENILKVAEELKNMLNDSDLDKIKKQSSVKIQETAQKDKMIVKTETMKPQEIQAKLNEKFQDSTFVKLQVEPSLESKEEGGQKSSERILHAEFSNSEKNQRKNKKIAQDLDNSQNLKIAHEQIQSKIFYLTEKLQQIQKGEEKDKFFEKQNIKFKQSQKIDVVLVIDTTATMENYLEQAKKCSADIINDFKEKYPDQKHDIQFGLVSYKDYDYEQKMCQLVELTNKVPQVQKAIKNLKADGGGDQHQAVHEGLHAVVTKFKKFRERSAKAVILICQAPPHGKQYHAEGYNELVDDFPDGHQEYSIQKISKLYKQKHIHLYAKLIFSKGQDQKDRKKNKNLQRMCQIFHNNFQNYFHYEELIDPSSYKDEAVKSIEDVANQFQKQTKILEDWLHDLVEKTKTKVKQSIQDYLVVEGDQKVKQNVKEKEERIATKERQLKEAQIKQTQEIYQSFPQIKKFAEQIDDLEKELSDKDTDTSSVNSKIKTVKAQKKSQIQKKNKIQVFIRSENKKSKAKEEIIKQVQKKFEVSPEEARRYYNAS